MADRQVRYPLDELELKPRGDGGAPLEVAHLRGVACCQVVARRGCEQAVQRSLGVVTEPGRAVRAGDVTLLPLAPRQWLLMAPHGRDGALARETARRLSGVGHVSDQGHGRVLFRVAGNAATELLTRGCRLDLDPVAAPPGFVAQTTMADVGVLMHRVERNVFHLLLYPGYARSFWDWLRETAAPMQPELREGILS